MKKLALMVLLVSVNLEVVVAQCSDGNVRLHEPDTSDPDRVTGVVQLCTSREWTTACRSARWYDNWDTHAANLVCKQLGYSSEGSTSDHICSQGVNNYIQEIDCDMTDSILQNCNFKIGDACTGHTCSGRKRHAAVSCQRVDCTDGDIRRMDGSTNREGRVEVCMDGRWGTVCNNSQEGIAEAVCSQLGFPPEGSFLKTYPSGIVPVYSCSLNVDSGLHCILSSDGTCDHSRDLGVYCLSREELDQVLHNNNLSGDTTTPCSCEAASSPAQTSGPSGPASYTINSQSNINCSDNGTIPENLKQFLNESGDRSYVSTSVLGGVVGVLVTVLVVLVIGWSLSCVALVKRNSHTQKQTEVNNSTRESTERQMDNPVYDTNMETHNYSSSGPIYTNDTVRQTFSVPERSGITAKTTTEDEENNYHVLESGESEGVTGGACDYEVPVSGQTNSRVDTSERKSTPLSRTEHNMTLT